MRHLLTGMVVAILACLIFSSSASAITIYDVKTDSWSAAGGDPYDWSNGNKYGSGGYSLMWSSINAMTGKLNAGGHPTGEYTGSWKSNPAWLDFQTGNTNNSGSGTYQPSGAITGNVIPRFYTLSSNTTGYRFDFSVYFFDPNLSAAIPDTDYAASVILSGNFGTEAGDPIASSGSTSYFNIKAITAAEIRAGTMVTFDVGVATGEEVAVTIETKQTYAVGFFMDKAIAWAPTAAPAPAGGVVPEPATMALLALGLGGLLRRRFRK